MFKWIQPPSVLDPRLLEMLKLGSDASAVDVAARVCEFAGFATPIRQETVDLLNRVLANFGELFDDPSGLEWSALYVEAISPGIAFSDSGGTGFVEDWPAAVQSFYAADLGILGPWLLDPESLLARGIKQGMPPQNLLAAIQLEFGDAMFHLGTVIGSKFSDWYYERHKRA